MRPRQGSLPQRPFFFCQFYQNNAISPPGCPATLTQFSEKFGIQLSLPNWVNDTWL